MTHNRVMIDYLRGRKLHFDRENTAPLETNKITVNLINQPHENVFSSASNFPSTFSKTASASRLPVRCITRQSLTVLSVPLTCLLSSSGHEQRNASRKIFVPGAFSTVPYAFYRVHLFLDFLVTPPHSLSLSSDLSLILQKAADATAATAIEASEFRARKAEQELEELTKTVINVHDEMKTYDEAMADLRRQIVEKDAASNALHAKHHDELRVHNEAMGQLKSQIIAKDAAFDAMHAEHLESFGAMHEEHDRRHANAERARLEQEERANEMRQQIEFLMQMEQQRQQRNVTSTKAKGNTEVVVKLLPRLRKKQTQRLWLLSCDPPRNT